MSLTLAGSIRRRFFRRTFQFVQHFLDNRKIVVPERFLHGGNPAFGYRIVRHGVLQFAQSILIAAPEVLSRAGGKALQHRFHFIQAIVNGLAVVQGFESANHLQVVFQFSAIKLLLPRINQLGQLCVFQLILKLIAALFKVPGEMLKNSVHIGQGVVRVLVLQMKPQEFGEADVFSLKRGLQHRRGIKRFFDLGKVPLQPVVVGYRSFPFPSPAEGGNTSPLSVYMAKSPNHSGQWPR